MNILAWLGRRATGALATGGILGLILPGSAEALQELLPFLVFAFTVGSFLKVESSAVGQIWQRPFLPSLLVIWSLVVSPFVVAFLVWLFPIPEGLAIAIILWAVSPPMIAAIIFALLLKLDAVLAMGVSIVGMLVMPITGPPLFLALTGLSVEIDTPMLTLRIAAFVVAAAMAAWAIRRLIGRNRLLRRSDEISGISVLILVVYGASLMPVVGEQLASNPQRVVFFIAAAFIANLGLQVVTGLLFAWSGRLHSTTSALLAGNRNMSVICANLGTSATPDIMLFFAAIHIPIYTLPWILRRLYALASTRKAMAEPIP